MVNAKNVKKIIKYGAEAATAGAIAYAGYSYLDSKTSDSSKKKKSTSQDTGQTTTEEATDESSGSGSSSSSGGSDGEYTTKVVDVPITNYNEALAFGNREWNKIKRDDGRELEVKVLGSCNWRSGEWCKVYLPSFDIDEYMYITRSSQSSDGGDWTTNLTLVDYPPGWGKEELGDNSDDSDSDSGSGDGSDDGSGDESSSGDENSSSGDESTPKTKDIGGETYYIYGDTGTDSSIGGVTYYNTGQNS